MTRFSSCFFLTYLLTSILWSNDPSWLRKQAEPPQVTPPPKAFKCIEGECVMQPVGTVDGWSLPVCRMGCGEHGSLWPKPTGTTVLSRKMQSISLSKMMFQYQDVVYEGGGYVLEEMVSVFRDRWNNLYGNLPGTTGKYGLAMVVLVQGGDPLNSELTLNTNEAYTLETACDDFVVTAKINATTPFGARHGLETLNQLMAYDEVGETLMIICEATIVDAPVYPWRGISLDTSRHFYPLEVLQHVIDAMSYNKMNRFHWHMTDHQSFPVDIPNIPEMAYYGAYSHKQIYFSSDLQRLRDYAKVRGVAIVPEIDAPSHVGHGWEWGKNKNFDDLLLCWTDTNQRDRCFGPPCGYLNPVNPHVYDTLQEIYRHLLNTLRPEVMHMGGDEVLPWCWNETQATQTWILEHGYNLDDEGVHKLWNHFQQRAYERLALADDKKPKYAVLWSSSLTQRYLEHNANTDDYIIQVWDSSIETNSTPALLAQGYKIIASNWDGWYLDCGSGSWVAQGSNWCSPFKEWQLIWTITDKNQLKLILGGEGAIWSEQIDPSNLDAKVWPRAAAIAERLWSDPSTCWYHANRRMQTHRERLVQLGVKAEALQPLWCLQHEEHCNVKPTDWDQFSLPIGTCPSDSEEGSGTD